MAQISAKQAGVLLFLVLCADAVVQPFGVQNNASAQIAIPVFCFQAAILIGFVLLLVRLPDAQPRTLAAAVLLLASCVFSAASALLRTEQFYRYSSDEALPISLTLGVLLLCVIYAITCHTHTLARAAGLLLWLFLASVGLLLIANYGGLSLVNLAYGQTGLWQESIQALQLPAELLVCFLLCKDTPRKTQRSFLQAIVSVAAVQILLCLYTELVMGSNAQAHSQMLHTLTRLGGISVFKRLDALHVAVWMLLFLLKITLLVSGAKIALTLICKKPQRIVIGVLLALLLGATALLSAVAQPYHGTLLSCFSVAALIAVTLRGGAYAQNTAG